VNLRLLPYGDRAVLAELDSLDGVLALHAALEKTRPQGVVDVVPAARTITVVVDPRRMPLESARSWIQSARAASRGPSAVAAGTGVASDSVAAVGSAGAPAGAAAAPFGRVVTIDVDYSGEDLPEVADILGSSVDEVIELHTGSTWRVAFGGFTLGFGYLVTDHDRLVVPRRQQSRPSVPAGSVGLAGEFSGVYPRSGPGGWQLIGVTDAPLWDPNRDPVALLQPGSTVVFRRRS
jgi:KipI family sensor histidine kinase inhibitor